VRDLLGIPFRQRFHVCGEVGDGLSQHPGNHFCALVRQHNLPEVGDVVQVRFSFFVRQQREVAWNPEFLGQVAAQQCQRAVVRLAEEHPESPNMGQVAWSAVVGCREPDRDDVLVTGGHGMNSREELEAGEIVLVGGLGSQRSPMHFGRPNIRVVTDVAVLDPKRDAI
jgi:hypothetical protein